MAGATLADAQSAQPDDRPHLLVVPDTAVGQAALERSDARVVARYGEFTLVEAAGTDDERLRRAGADRRDDMREVRLPATDLDPRRDRASLAAKRAPDRDEILAVVQFIGPVKDAWFERLRETGAQVVQYASQNAYLVHARNADVERLTGLAGTDTAVRAVVPVSAEDKVADGLVRGGERTMAVQTIVGDAGAGARREAAAAGPRVRAESSVGQLRTQFVRIDGTEAAALAEDPGVVSITPWSPPRLLDEQAARIVAGDLGGGPFDYLGWLAGKGFPSTTFPFAIDVTDQGLDNGNPVNPGHPDFRENGLQDGPSRVAYTKNYTGEVTAADCGGHGTNVASIAAGFGRTGAGHQDGAGFRYGLGISPRAEIGASKIFTCNGTFDFDGSFTELTRAAHADGARISNNSWGLGGLGFYSAESRLYDSLVRDARPDQSGNQQMVEVFAAGNNGGRTGGSAFGEGYGTVQDPATAKNVITVGASESTRPIGGVDRCGITDAQANNPNDILDFSSRGPTDDLRLKPDLVAPGTHVVGASPQHGGYQAIFLCNAGSLTGNPFYSLLSGTSQAAPEVAGAAALIRDWHVREHGAPPSPAMTKALLVNTATDVAGGDNGKGAAVDSAPNADQGWGRVHVGAALDSPGRLFYDQSSELTATGQSFDETYEVADTSRPLKVTLAWTDAPGLVGPQAAAYVNDLDLVVEAGGHTYNGNVFAGGRSRPGGAPDPRNNVENVTLPAGTGGDFAVRVLAKNIPGDGVPGDGDGTDQDFALVVSNATEEDSPVLVHESTSVDDSTPPGGDNDDVLEPNEVFGLREGIRNAGDAAATGVSGSLSSTGITFTPSTSPWPNIGVGATAANTTMFSGKLPPQQELSCGADVAATLDITTAQGQGTVPLTLATGETQPPAGATRTHSPGLAIPDGSPAGVTSTIQVALPGRIKDLNVTINGITHPFVGDLRIDVVGPDGTTVTLAEHPGGPDNNGRNFVGTVFSDEAATNISSGSPPYTGTFRPQNDQLSRFDGKQRQGTWTLRVRDLAQGSTGTLGSWGTRTQIAGCDFGGEPSTTIDAQPPNPSSTRDAVFNFSSPNTQGARFECRLDGADFEDCSSPRTYSGLPDGSHTFAVRALDASGNVDTVPPSYTWMVDAPPETTITSGPNGPVSSTQAVFGFQADEAGATFTCQTDGQAQAPCTSPVTVQGLSDGPHTFRVWATDSSGKQDATPATRTWTVDTTPPDTSIQSGPVGLVNRRDAAFNLGASEAGASFQCALDGGPTTACSSPATFAGLGDGAHTVSVRAVDAAGNADPEPAARSWVVDATPPALSISSPRSGQAVTDVRPEVAGNAGTASGDAGTVFLHFYSGRLAAGLPVRTLVVPRDGRTGAWSARPAPLADGTWTVRAEQADAAGNTGTSAPVAFEVDTTPPTFAIVPSEAYLADAIGRGVPILAGCASSCRIVARLSVGGATGRALGLPTKRDDSQASYLLGTASRRVGRAGAVAVALRPSPAARSAMRKLGSLKAKLTVGVTASGATVKLRQSVLLSRSAGMQRMSQRGLRFRGACSEPCGVEARLKVAAGDARRLRLKPSGSGPMTLASGRAGASRTPRLVLVVDRRYRAGLRRARRGAKATLEAAVRGRRGPLVGLKSRLNLHP